MTEVSQEPAGITQQAPPPAPKPAAGHSVGLGTRLRQLLSFRNISAIYVFVALFILFALWVPNTFLTEATWKSLLNQQATSAIVALALVIPMSAGAFDLAVGTEVGLGAILVAWFLQNQGVPVLPAILLTVLAGCLVGAISGFFIVKVRIDSFIATLGMSSILLAAISWISNGQQVLGLSKGFREIANGELLGLVYPVWIMLAIAFACWYLLERTPAGRRIYATGGNIDAARLTGVKTSRVIVLSLMSCGAIAAFAGILVSSGTGVGDPGISPSYLLPAFTAVFLGSTQFRGGRFNIWGTVVAVYVLATGVKGFQLAGAPFWLPELFNGVALLIAVGLAKYQSAVGRPSQLSRLFGFARKTPAGEPAAK